MIPHDIVRNPFLQFQWLPCVNVGSLEISPFTAVYIVGMRYCAYTDQIGDTDPHSVVLEVVNIANVSNYAAFDASKLAFSGPHTLVPYVYGINKPDTYGMCNIGDIGVARCHQPVGAIALSHGDHCAFTATGILAKILAGSISYPGLYTFLGYTSTAVLRGSASIDTAYGLFRIRRDAAITGGFVHGADSSVIPYATIAGGLAAYAQPSAENWFYTLGIVAGTITVNYSGWYNVDFGARCMIPGYGSDTEEVTLTLYDGTTYRHTTVSTLIVPSYSGGVVYDYSEPFLSAVGLEYCTAGQVMQIRMVTGYSGMAFQDFYFHLTLNTGC